MRLGSISAALTVLSCPALSFGQQLQVTADLVEYDASTQSTVFRRNARLTHDDFFLEADQIHYHRDQKRAVASGNVVANYRDFRILSSLIEYELDSGRLRSGQFRLGSVPFFATGESFNGTVERLEVNELTLFIGQPTRLSPNLTAESATLVKSERVEAQQVTLRIGSVPLLGLTRYSHRLDTQPFDLSAKVGSRGNLGAYLQTEILLPVLADGMIGASIHGYSKRGILFGPSLHHRSGESDQATFTTLRSGYIDDFGDRGFDILGDPIEADRYFLEIRHRSRLSERIDLKTKFNLWSDSEILRDFAPDQFWNDQHPDHFAEVVYRGDASYLSAFARFQPNDFHLATRRVPEIRFDYLPSRVFRTSVYQRFNAALARIERNDLRLEPLPRSGRIDLHYTLYRPVRINKWLHVLPRIGSRITHYTEVFGTREEFTRVLAELGLDVEVKAHATWDYTNESWSIHGLRHLLKPTIRYRYYPGAKYGNNEIIPIDVRAFSTALQPIDLGNMREIDDLTDLNVIRFGIENLLQTRDAQYGPRNLAELNLYQDLVFSTEPGEQNWTDCYTQLRLTPAPWLRLDLINRLNPETLTIEDTRTALTVFDGDKWRLSMRTNYLRNAIDQYELSFAYKINERWNLENRTRFDARRGEFSEEIFSIKHRLAHTWQFEFQVAFHMGSTREDEFDLNLRVNLLQL